MVAPRSSVVHWAPAKLNLFLEVLGRRTDGFHTIETLMVKVSLYDRLDFWPMVRGDSTLSVDCRWAMHDGEARFGALPPAEENLVTVALERLRSHAGVAAGARVELRKNIPPASGLAGGSSDAASALLAANVGWELHWPRKRLARVGAEVGSDVPFFLGTAAAICRGRGEQVEPVGRLARLWAVVVRPPEGLSTRDVYAQVDTSDRPRSLGPLLAALQRGDWRELRSRLHNRLEPAAARLSPWITRLREEFKSADCLAEQMSGSGSSYFGICRNARHAQRLATRLASRGLGCVYAVST